MMRRTFANWGGRPWWFWRRLADRRKRRESAIVIGGWTAGDNTTLALGGGKARATAIGANNPRISRHVTGLTEGTLYRVRTVTYSGTASSVFFRVSATQNLDAGDYVNQSSIGAIDETFTAPAGGEVYIGIVPVVSADGDYAETDETFTVEAWTPFDLGSSLLAWWDASAGVSLSNSSVTAWQDRKGGYSAAQGTSANRPTWSATGFNGAPGLTFDGTNDELTLASQPFGTGAINIEIWAVVQQDVAGATAGSRTMIAFGSGTTTNNRFRLYRTTGSSINRLGGSVGTGASSVAFANLTSVFDGRCLVRCRVTPTTVYASLNGGTEASAAAVPSIGSTRVRIGADAGDTPNIYWQGKIRDVIVTGALSTAQAASLQTFLLARRML